MSLVAEAKFAGSRTREFINSEVPHIRDIFRRIRNEIRTNSFVRDTTYDVAIRYAFAGVAIDYRIRAFFSADFFRSFAIQQGISRLERIYSTDPVNLWENAFCRKDVTKTLAGRTFRYIEDFISKNPPMGRKLESKNEFILAQLCCICAGIDACSRGSLAAFDYMCEIAREDIYDMLSNIDVDLVTDVSTVFSNSFNDLFKMFSQGNNFHPGARFAGSEMIGGADCDIIVDDRLIDFKASKIPNLRIEYVYQIIGYFLLDFEDQFRLNTLSIFYPRHSFWIDVAIEELFDRSRVGEIRARYREIIKAEYERRLSTIIVSQRKPSAIDGEEMAK